MGYFIFRQEIFDFIKDGEELVHEPFNRMIKGGHLLAYKYDGFWRAMDTLRDRQLLEGHGGSEAKHRGAQTREHRAPLKYEDFAAS